MKREYKILLALSILLLIMGPLCIYILLIGAIGPLAELMLMWLSIPMILGFMAGITWLSIYVRRAKPDARRRAVAAFGILLFSFGLLVTLAAAVRGIRMRNGANIDQAQAIKLINECQISSIQQTNKGIELMAASGVNASGTGSNYITTSSDWNTLVNTSSRLGNKCDQKVDVLRESPIYSWISLENAQQLLLTCAIQNVALYNGPYDTTIRNFGTPKGTATGYALLDPGTTSKDLELTKDAVAQLRERIGEAQTRCNTVVVSEVFDN
jgi:hypothetical protein